MEGFFPPDTESFQGDAGFGSSGLHEYGSGGRPFLEDDAIESDTASFSGYIHVQNSPHRRMSPPLHRSR